MPITELVAKARALLQSSRAEAALTLLQANFEPYTEDVQFLQIFGETLLENNDVENAYEVLTKACSSDPKADAGVEKFFYLGQIIGGQDGLALLDIGLNKLNSHLDKPELTKYVIKKLNQGIFAKIEIWMTDLCMEEEAESKCDELINYSLSLDAQNPEALSLLASIRISQQRPDEARQALSQSWAIFKQKKITLEESANKIRDSGDSEESDSFEVGLEYIELIQPLLTLARFAIEMELYDTTIEIASSIQDVNESILEPYYYEALAGLFNAKKLYVETSKEQLEDYRDLEIALLKKSTNDEIKALLAEAKSTLTLAYKIINSEGENDPEVVEQVQILLEELGGPVMSELMPQRVDEEGWEDEIESEGE
ncbi:uncharacterized protein CANTADRAFT_54103 [Suhomyces tanzawaensis NRRL Y-17324]|uniref:TPR-like protein n=1 Tax=Suhomyces tanzawaensis NRRL Y-17324 TaxID=984487 RepID=A0A1E4SET1_9ASCO|nr:uncharacterized protein CANTADRAFT_54103 [Suhomyces tanzawaensis NRRL Y-17324]ODV77998.1 hypothetical protein CANTADRAFT_54103 [Suhomyces tanzawaensis NRRL Y-17324]